MKQFENGSVPGLTLQWIPFIMLMSGIVEEEYMKSPLMAQGSYLFLVAQPIIGSLTY